jgi:hypothetical protein
MPSRDGSTHDEVMMKHDRLYRVIQVLAAAVVVAGWLYILVFTFHNWTDRLLFGGFAADGLTGGIMFERWRQRGDYLARVPFFIAAAALAATIIVGSISPREFVLAGCIAVLGTVAAWSVRAVGPGRAVAGVGEQGLDRRRTAGGIVAVMGHLPGHG